MIDTNDSEFLSRIEDKSLLSKVMPGAAAAAMINAGDIIGISGFTPCGYPKITMHETDPVPGRYLDRRFHRFPDRYRTGCCKRRQSSYALPDKR